MEIGGLAYARGRWKEGHEHLLAGLRDLLDCPDAAAMDRALTTVARAWRTSGDGSLPAAAAEVLRATPDEAEAVLRKMLPQE